MNRMNIGQLEFALAVATNKSFTAAADHCHVTQPTLSNGIAQLEEELGGRLFERTTRSVSLTPLGTHLLGFITQALAGHAAVIQEAKAFLHPEKQMIRVGLSPLLNTAVLGSILDPFRRENPQVELVLREMNMGNLFRMLNDGLLDYVFAVAETHRAGWAHTFLYDESLFYIPSGGDPQAGQRGPVS